MLAAPGSSAPVTSVAAPPSELNESDSTPTRTPAPSTLKLVRARLALSWTSPSLTMPVGHGGTTLVPAGVVDANAARPEPTMGVISSVIEATPATAASAARSSGAITPLATASGADSERSLTPAARTASRVALEVSVKRICTTTRPPGRCMRLPAPEATRPTACDWAPADIASTCGWRKVCRRGLSLLVRPVSTTSTAGSRPAAAATVAVAGTSAASTTSTEQAAAATACARGRRRGIVGVGGTRRTLVFIAVAS